MKKLFTLIAWILALNFLAALGGVVYLNRTGHLDKARVMAIKDLLFPPPAPPPVAPVAVADSTTQPSFQLDTLLAKAAGRSAGDQIAFIQQSFDSRMAELDRRQRELTDQQQLVDIAKTRLAVDRAALETEKKQVAAREQQDTKLLTDQGFQDTLQLYNTMKAPQVKQIFANMIAAGNEKTVAEYIQAMDPGTASKIIKEFKTPAETLEIQKVLDMVRQPSVTENN